MKAIVYHKSGSGDVLKLEEIEKPVPKDDEVLIKVRAASVNPLDYHLLRHAFLRRIMSTVSKGKITRPGRDVSGVILEGVEAVGRIVMQFKPGDEVFGTCSGAFAELPAHTSHRSRSKNGDNWAGWKSVKGLEGSRTNVSFEQAASSLPVVDSPPCRVCAASHRFQRNGKNTTQRPMTAGRSALLKSLCCCFLELSCTSVTLVQASEPPQLKTAYQPPDSVLSVVAGGLVAGKKGRAVAVIESAELLQAATAFTHARQHRPFILVTPLVVTNGGPGYRSVPTHHYTDPVWKGFRTRANSASMWIALLNRQSDLHPDAKGR